MEDSQHSSREILAMERAALDQWGKGNPDGILAIYDPEITYFDPFQAHRVDGFEEMQRYYDSFRGQVRIERDEIVEPKVQIYGDVAVLTFRYNSRVSEKEMHWNATEVYRRTDEGWRIIHSHWSLTQPKLASQ